MFTSSLIAWLINRLLDFLLVPRTTCLLACLYLWLTACLFACLCDYFTWFDRDGQLLAWSTLTQYICSLYIYYRLPVRQRPIRDLCSLDPNYQFSTWPKSIWYACCLLLIDHLTLLDSLAIPLFDSLAISLLNSLAIPLLDSLAHSVWHLDYSLCVHFICLLVLLAVCLHFRFWWCTPKDIRDKVRAIIIKPYTIILY